MRILIADDMEGISGVVNWDHVDPDHAEYARFRQIMTAEVNAAIRGAFKGGADEVVVSDGHHNGLNVLIEELDSRARLNSGSPSPLSMVQGVDQADAVIFIGYHARAGTLNAVLCHTWTTKITNVWLNNRPIGEFGVNASVAGYYGAPVLMISGDQAACAEATEWVEGIETVVVKTATGRYSAECLSPEVTHPMIEDAAERAVRRFAAGQGPKPIATTNPVWLRMQFTNAGQADGAAEIPGSTRLDGYTVEMTAANMHDAYQTFRVAATMGSGK